MVFVLAFLLRLLFFQHLLRLVLLQRQQITAQRFFIKRYHHVAPVYLAHYMAFFVL